MRRTTRSGDESCQGNIPAEFASFIGRRRELTELRASLAGSRLVTLTGFGGVGKTRLATRLAAETRAAFPGGAWLVELSPLREPDLVADTAASALGVRTGGTGAPLALLRAHLQRSATLLVLDNCEHVLQGCRVFVEDLLRHCPELRVLATSREPLQLPGERVIAVPTMAIPGADTPLDDSSVRRYDALILLQDRAAGVRAGFTLTGDDLRAAAALCAALDGIPLALELAATRLRSLTVRQLLERVQNRFGVLTKGSPSAPERQQTLHALVAWSYERCSPAEQLMWRRMSVFAGGADLDAVETVCAGDEDGQAGIRQEEVLDLVDGLVAKSVLSAEPGPDGVRYRLLETVRQFGAERAAETGSLGAARKRHLDHFLMLATHAEEGFWSTQQSNWLHRLNAEHGNLRAALGACSEAAGSDAAATGMRLSEALRAHWLFGGFLSEGRRWLDAALKRDSSNALGRAESLCVAAWISSVQGDLPAAVARLDECDRLLACERPGRETDGRIARISARVHTFRGSVALFSGELHEAEDALVEAARGHRAHGDVEGQLITLFQLGLVCSLRGDHAGAASACRDSLAVSEDVGESYARSNVWWVQAFDAFVQGDADRADERARWSLRAKLELGDRLGAALVTEVMASTAVLRADHERAAILRGIAHHTWDIIGSSLSAFGRPLADVHAGTAGRASQALGSRRYDVAFERGRRLSAAEAWECRLSAPSPLASAQVGQADVDRALVLLTKRERQVATLLAEGLSNRDIAARLVVSHRTVEGHVERVLVKTGCATRGEVTALLARTGVP